MKREYAANKLWSCVTSISISVDIARNLSRLAPDQAKEVGSLQILAALGVSVALGALLDENFLSLGFGHFLFLFLNTSKSYFCDARQILFWWKMATIDGWIESRLRKRTKLTQKPPDGRFGNILGAKRMTKNFLSIGKYYQTCYLITFWAVLVNSK